MGYWVGWDDGKGDRDIMGVVKFDGEGFIFG